MSLNSHLVKSSKPPGTVRSSSLEDLLLLKSKIPTLFLSPPNWIKSPLPLCLTLVTLRFWYAQLFALIWVAFQYHILELTKDGFAYAMDPSTINSVESDKDQLKLTCLISTTLSSVQLSALRNNNSLTSHPFSSMCEHIGYRCVFMFI